MEKNKKNDNLAPIRKQSALIFTICVCIMVLIVAAIVSSDMMFKGTYSVNENGDLTLADLYALKQEYGEDKSFTVTETVNLSDGGTPAGTNKVVSVSDGSTVRMNYDTSGDLLSSSRVSSSGVADRIAVHSDKSSLPSMSTIYYNENSTTGFGDEKNFDSYTQTFDYSKVGGYKYYDVLNETWGTGDITEIVKNYSVKSNSSSTSSGTRTVESVLTSTRTKIKETDAQTGNEVNTVRFTFEDMEPTGITITDPQGSGKKVDLAEARKIVQDANQITYYESKAECETVNDECNQIGTLYVDDDAMNYLIFYDESYCQQVNKDECKELKIPGLGTRYTSKDCNCEEGCLPVDDKKEGECSPGVGSPCSYNGQSGVVGSDCNCNVSGGGNTPSGSIPSSGSVPSGGSVPSSGSTPTPTPTPPNVCVYHCDPDDPETPIFVDPGTVIYPVTSCWSCVANDGSGTKYVKANNFRDAANATAGNYCKIVSSTSCDNAPEVDTSGTYCWSCIKNNKKVYAKANLASTAMTITGGDACTIVSMSTCNIERTPTPTPTNVDVNPKTGMVAMVIAWIVGLIAIVYSLWYFRKTSLLKNK